MPIKLTTTPEGEIKWGEKEKISKRIYRIRKIRTIKVFLESLLLEFFPSLAIIVYLTSLGCPPTLY